MTPEQSNALSTFYQALIDEPLEPGDANYVPFYQSFGDDPVRELAMDLVKKRVRHQTNKWCY